MNITNLTIDEFIKYYVQAYGNNNIRWNVTKDEINAHLEGMKLLFEALQLKNKFVTKHKTTKMPDYMYKVNINRIFDILKRDEYKRLKDEDNRAA